MSETDEKNKKISDPEDKMPSNALINFHLTQMEYVKKCGKDFKKYEECVNDKEKSFDFCYRTYYQDFINCYEKSIYSGY